MTAGRLRFVGAATLIVGLASAIFIYVLAEVPPDNPLGYDPMQSKLYVRNLELYGGQANVLAVKLVHWFESLWSGPRLAYPVACATVLLTLAFWVAAVAYEELPGESEAGARRSET